MGSLARVVWRLLTGMVLAIGALAIVAHLLPQAPRDPDAAPGPEWFSEQLPLYAEHRVLTALHLACGAAFVVLAPLQLARRFRDRNRRRHGRLGRVVLATIAGLAISGTVLGLTMPFGGPFQTLVAVSLSVAVVYAGARAVKAARAHELETHQAWMARMFAWTMSVATTRLIFGLWFAAQPLDARTWFMVCNWIGWLINAVLAEVWILGRTRGSASNGAT